MVKYRLEPARIPKNLLEDTRLRQNLVPIARERDFTNRFKILVKTENPSLIKKSFYPGEYREALLLAHLPHAVARFRPGARAATPAQYAYSRFLGARKRGLLESERGSAVGPS